jgi:hypothetical protein
MGARGSSAGAVANATAGLLVRCWFGWRSSKIVIFGLNFVNFGVKIGNTKSKKFMVWENFELQS